MPIGQVKLLTQTENLLVTDDQAVLFFNPTTGLLHVAKQKGALVVHVSSPRCKSLPTNYLVSLILLHVHVFCPLGT